MKKACIPLLLMLLVSGCSTFINRDNPSGVCAGNAYEVTVDSWCGSRCDSYPVSHKLRDTRLENNRVELVGTRQTSSACASP